ncbi:MAG: NAD(P)-binding domain-containing protein, partial [Bacteroidia bacterium]|nr:NAD(P)-binding domain-containing protein [Bacteroidia bacterium]
MASNKIGVIGSGQVAQVLASGFLNYGYEVMVGTSNTAKLTDWKSKNAKGQVGSFEEAASFGEVLVLAVKGAAAVAVITSIASKLAGKIVVDTTNPIAEAPPANGVLKYFTTLEDSLMERLQKVAPQAKFVKAFNCVGNSFMVNPSFPGEKPTMFICGNDNEAKKAVTTILDQFGWETADFGLVESARAIEPLCML